MRPRRFGIACLVLVGIWLSNLCGAAAAVDRIRSGPLEVEPPTLQSLGFEWYVEGDDNRNAEVAVSYRKRGETTWREGHPLIRLHGEKNKGPGEFVAPNVFVGSLFDLEPGTEYECRFVLADPDGVRGRRQQIVTARTRAEPRAAGGGRVFHVYPHGYRGPFQEPAFYGLYAAWYDSDGVAADHYNAYPPRVRPGDTILVHGGVYRETREYYGSSSSRAGGTVRADATCCGTTWDGTYYLTTSGTADAPIVIKAAGDGPVIFDGGGNQTLFNVTGGNHLYFEGLTFRDTNVAIEAGRKGIAGARGLTVRHSRFENVGVGIHTDWSGSGDFTITDNEFIGRVDPDHLVGFVLRPPFDTVPGIRREYTQQLSQYAVKIYGSGHVVAHNRIRNFHDGIDFATYGLPDGYPDMPRDRMPVSNDINDNDISLVHDDCIEADGALYNIRIYRNLCANTGGSAFSTQPVWGLAWFIRNVVYHDPGNFASLKLATPTAAVFYHNTFLAPVYGGRTTRNRLTLGGPILIFRNNLVLAQDPTDAAFVVGAFTNASSSDYNGFMAGARASYRYGWHSPPFDDRRAEPDGALEPRTYATLAEYSRDTGQDTHSVELDYGAFRDLAPARYDDPTRVHDPAALDFTLKAGGPAVDRGVRLPNINDAAVGAAPDLGALELGGASTRYGPRPKER